ncbi:MAG: ankyrin repeat domain-containing protein [Bryobacteraceae bacterium]
MWSRLALILLCAAPAFAQSDSLASLIQSGNRKAALEKIRAGADVNAAQPDGTRPVHWAVFRVDHELLQALIAKKAKVDVANEFGSTPIAEAAKLADATMVKMLLDAGAEPEGANADGQSALMLAIKTGELPVIELLLAKGANVNVVEKFENQTPLMWAAAAPKNAAAMVKLLLAKGANVKPRAKFTDWPTQLTSEPRAQYRPTGGLTALLYAARNGCYDCVAQLLDAGADPNLPTPEGVTPLIMTLDNEHNEIAKLLMDRGAKPGTWDWWGRTPLYIVVDRKAAAGGGRGGRGAAPAPVRTTGPTPVTGMEIIVALLAAEVDPSPQLNMHRPSRGGNSGRFGDTQLSTGATPLLRAVQANDTEVSRALLAKGANPNVNAMGTTPFMLAAGVAPGRGGAPGGAPNTQLLDLMLQNGADINAQVTGTKTYSMRVSRSPATNEGASALHAAAQGGRTELVKYLLSKGANPELLDAEGRKPIDLVGFSTQGAGRAGPGAATANAANAASAAEIRALLQAVKK